MSNKPQIDRIMNGKKAGTASINQLTHKDGTPLKDYEYLCLVGEKANKAEAHAKSINGVPNYEGMDPAVVALGKEVVRGREAGMTESQLTDFVAQCITLQ